ncbi:MAG: ornithine carbamoyltransferase [Chloroflexi bacterium]|uniref:Ornithine carbamoyltransferase n=1 Tax=Candidatus Chlorohelix allophototropha TaxID=3003348 RepID=A0A8T7LYF0_9CHLR|nr:ornithine carbamoyltransferase [Chloroflexota bacterium]WJW67818.1 ornithine carbamoyltransferase [Chloroflexota bacterium L227-S17]
MNDNKVSFKPILKGRHLLSSADLNAQELAQVLDTALDLKARLKRGEPTHILEGKSLAMIFEHPSLRTRLSFDIGMYQLGGRAFYLAPTEIGLGRRETPSDVARVISSMADGILARVRDHTTLLELANYSSKPLINGLTDREHPCQVLADLLTIRERFGKLTGLTMAYIGDGNNMAQSLALASALSGLNITIITPPQYWPDEEIVHQARQLANGKSFVKVSNSPEAVGDADVIYTDVWASMGQESEAELRRRVFKPYQINSNLLEMAKPNALVLHCLPAHRGDEVTEEVLEGSQSAVFQQAENRLHAQKGLLVHLLAD